MFMIYKQAVTTVIRIKRFTMSVYCYLINRSTKDCYLFTSNQIPE